MDWLVNPRRREREWMDQPGVDPSELRRSLRFIRRINSWLGYTRALIQHLDHFCRNWTPGQRIDIIDLATGSGDIPRAILAWSQRRGFDVHIVGVDLHPVTIRAAADMKMGKWGSGGVGKWVEARLHLVQADVFDLPFEDGAFDYAISAMFLHHLDEEQIVRVLRTLDRLSRRGIIVADLLRHRRAMLWIKLLTLWARPMVRHDALASVRQSLAHGEVLSLRDRAGVGYASYHRHFGHRFVLAGEKRRQKRSGMNMSGAV